MVSISAIKPIVTKGFSYLRRGAKVYAPVVFGESSEILGNAYKSSIKTKNFFKKEFWSQLWQGTKNAGRAAEAYSAKVGGNKAVLKNLWTSTKNLPKALTEGWKNGRAAAKAAGKSGLLGSLKGAFGNISKKLPGFGSLILLALEAPNIIKATKEKGLLQGLKETGKAAARLGGFTLGSAIGSAICPGVGTIIGGLLGDWLAGKIVGKSYSEKKAEEEALAAEQAQQQAPAFDQSGYTTNPYAATMTPDQIAQYQKMLYSGNNSMNDDFMAQAFGIQKPMAQFAGYQQNPLQNPFAQTQKLNYLS